MLPHCLDARSSVSLGDSDGAGGSPWVRGSCNRRAMCTSPSAGRGARPLPAQPTVLDALPVARVQAISESELSGHGSMALYVCARAWARGRT